LLDDPQVGVVGGFFNAESTTLFELAMGATVLPLVNEIDPATFLPSSRSIAFRKSAWAAVGGYPEWLDYCEDLVFDLRLKALSRQSPVASRQFSEKDGRSDTHENDSPLETGNSKLATSFAFAFAADAVVAFRPRGSFRAFFRQYYRYARGDGKADLWRKRHAARYLTYGLAAPLVLVLGIAIHPLFWLLVIPGAVYYLRQPYGRLQVLMRRHAGTRRALSLQERWYLLALVPLIRVVGDVAKMIGYPVGIAWRLRQHPPDWRRLEG
ncbi:MAG: hypothetical protein K8I30_18995, partial [Anaerolineae bacterium]|nr:hypothetical protein [Anaerolineae bacterium]